MKVMMNVSDELISKALDFYFKHNADKEPNPSPVPTEAPSERTATERRGRITDRVTAGVYAHAKGVPFKMNRLAADIGLLPTQVSAPLQKLAKAGVTRMHYRGTWERLK